MGQSINYRKEAEDCRKYAHRQIDSEWRAMMLRLAEHWEFAARQLEGRGIALALDPERSQFLITGKTVD